MAALEEAHARLLEQNRTMQDQLQARLRLLCNRANPCLSASCVHAKVCTAAQFRMHIASHECIPLGWHLAFHPPYWCPTCCRV